MATPDSRTYEIGRFINNMDIDRATQGNTDSFAKVAGLLQKADPATLKTFNERFEMATKEGGPLGLRPAASFDTATSFALQEASSSIIPFIGRDHQFDQIVADSLSVARDSTTNLDLKAKYESALGEIGQQPNIALANNQSDPTIQQTASDQPRQSAAPNKGTGSWNPISWNPIRSAAAAPSPQANTAAGNAAPSVTPDASKPSSDAPNTPPAKPATTSAQQPPVRDAEAATHNHPPPLAKSTKGRPGAGHQGMKTQHARVTRHPDRRGPMAGDHEDPNVTAQHAVATLKARGNPDNLPGPINVGGVVMSTDAPTSGAARTKATEFGITHANQITEASGLGKVRSLETVSGGGTGHPTEVSSVTTKLADGRTLAVGRNGNSVSLTGADSKVQSLNLRNATGQWESYGPNGNPITPDSKVISAGSQIYAGVTGSQQGTPPEKKAAAVTTAATKKPQYAMAAPSPFGANG